MISILPKIKLFIAHVRNYTYHWVTAFFVVWVLFFDQNNLCRSISDIVESHRLEKEKKFYLEKIDRYSIMLNELKTSDENLVKFAREQYYMKAEDEDVFVIEEE